MFSLTCILTKNDVEKLHLLLRTPLGGCFYIILATMILLQLQTIRTSNALYNESTAITLERIHKKITKLSMQIMVMLCFFLLPYTTLFSVLHSTIKDQVNDNESSVLDFVTSLSILLVYANSFGNGVLFLMANVKAKRFFES